MTPSPTPSAQESALPVVWQLETVHSGWIVINEREADRFRQHGRNVRALYATPPIQQGVAWQPIETAPKDGTVVRLFCEGFIDPDFNPGGSVEGFWLEDIGWMGAVWNNHQDCWGTHEDIQPTHWMPLPAHPSLRATSGENGNG